MAIAQEPGVARSPGLSYQQLLDTDTHEVPEVLREESPRFLGDEDVSIERYISPRLASSARRSGCGSGCGSSPAARSTCPNAGDYVALRDRRACRSSSSASTTDEIKAYPNACLHRGRQLKEYDGHCTEIRCPFHGFAWALDGSLAGRAGARGTSPTSTRRGVRACPRSRSARGPGSCSSTRTRTPSRSRTSSAAWPTHFERWDLEQPLRRRPTCGKVIRANWKIAQEAFCEAFHVNATHPQILPYLGDTNSQVDVWDTFSRVITPAATPSPLLDWAPDEETILRYALDVRVDEELFITVKDGQTARSAMADATRDRWRPIVGDLVDEWSDAEMIDNLDYTLFPNFHPWGAFNRIVYRFRPNGDDHRSSDHGGVLPGAVQGRAAAAVARPHARTRTSRGPTRPSSACSARCSSRTRSTWARVQLGLETHPQARRSRWPTTRRARCAGRTSSSTSGWKAS